jgi:hypothetical protein
MAEVKPSYRHCYSGSNKVDDEEDEAVGPEYDLTFNQSYLNYLSLPGDRLYVIHPTIPLRRLVHRLGESFDRSLGRGCLQCGGMVVLVAEKV